ncbi:hypothetical protein [Natronobeatus ordinarius]|uniref:hypothetical protein n=1 Tax=Natronobeatus ordinarius TaxID=2963433 RepID=UPI0020CC762A|nr:hypothetical protein [Natronobeatus ordinarius]
MSHHSVRTTSYCGRRAVTPQPALERFEHNGSDERVDPHRRARRHLVGRVWR